MRNLHYRPLLLPRTPIRIPGRKLMLRSADKPTLSVFYGCPPALSWIYGQGGRKRREPKQRLRQAEELAIPPQVAAYSRPILAHDVSGCQPIIDRACESFELMPNRSRRFPSWTWKKKLAVQGLSCANQPSSPITPGVQAVNLTAHYLSDLLAKLGSPGSADLLINEASFFGRAFPGR